MTPENEMPPDERKQRELLDKAGDVLVRLTHDRTSVNSMEVDDAMDVLASIEQHPTSEPFRAEAAQKLDQLNRTRSVPQNIET